MKILIADDHELFLKGLEFMLQSNFPKAKICTATDYKKLFSILQKEKNFSLIITDLAMPGANSIEGIKKIHNLNSQTPILILSAVFDKGLVKNTIDSGVSGYILKASSNTEILNAINVVLTGEKYIPSELANKESENMQMLIDSNENIRKEDFSPQQLKILTKIVAGLSNKQIAYELNLSEGTVKCYITTIMKKLNVLNRTSAGLKALKAGIVSENK